jgi:penicillin-insensitive murein endopeptidase
MMNSFDFALKSIIQLLSCFICILFFSFNCFADSIAQKWAAITNPAAITGNAQSIGTYNAGCLSGAVSLPLNGEGYQVMRLSRNRYYGHPALIKFIQDLGKQAVDKKIGTLLIGDLGQPRGGPTISGHRSHQTGLDVDVWFLLSEQANQHLLTVDERETWSATSVVNPVDDNVDRQHWSLLNEKVLELAALRPEVDRIFVNPSIKREICNHKTPASSMWLHKIRPWWKHDDHFHIRLKCPVNNPNCAGQEPLATADGCGADLDWWFTAEAKTPAQGKPAPPPPLPSLCEQVLKN